MLGIGPPGLPILARIGNTPHENPAMVAGVFDSAVLLLSYSQIISQALNSRYQSARETLKDLEKADIPDDFRFITDRYHALNHNLFITLENLESLLDETADLLALNRVDEARRYLNSSKRVLQDADNLIGDIQAATYSVSEKLGVLAAAATDRLSEAYKQLEENMTRLAALMERYKSIREDLEERYSRMAGLAPTTLTLYITPEAAFVGDSVEVTGSLKSTDGSLEGKRISIAAEGLSVGTVITGHGGCYTDSISVPFLYQEEIAFTAGYEPSGGDSRVFLASRSEPVNINASFYITRFETKVPDKIYRGLPFTVSGDISTGDRLIARCVNVFLDDRPLTEATVSGRFSFEVTPPPDALPGRRNLKIAVSPEGRYSGVVKNYSVNLVTTILRIETQTSAIFLLPASVHISGTVSSGTSPLADEPVVLTLMNSSTTVKTASDGSFNGFLKIWALPAEAPLAGNPLYIAAPSEKTPHDLFPIGSHRLRITAEIPGHTTLTSTVEKSILTINPLSSGLILAIIAVAVLAFYRKKRTKTIQATEIASPEFTGLTVKTTDSTPLPAPAKDITGIKGRVLSAYQNGLAAVEKISGVIMAPSETLREFLKMVRLPSPATAACFTELTTIAESSLYSSGNPPDFVAARAEELAESIKEELQRGNP